MIGQKYWLKCGGNTGLDLTLVVLELDLHPETAESKAGY